MNASLAEQVESILRRLGEGITEKGWALGSRLATDLVPEETWALLAFLQHERRQRWVGEVVESRLWANGVDLAGKGWLGHPEQVAGRGEVPGEAGWSYDFHGRGCCFTHQDGTQIDVDFAEDGSALQIDPYFYGRFLRSAPALGWIEQRLKHPEGLERAWRFDLGRLAELGLIEREHRFWLTPAGRRLAETLDPLVRVLEQPNRVARCVVLTGLGDFVSACEVAKGSSLQNHLLVELARRQCEQRASVVRAALQSSQDSAARDALAALAILGKERAFAPARLCLQQMPVTSLNRMALTALTLWPDPDVVACLNETLELMTHSSVTGKISSWFGSKSSTEESRPRLGLIVGLAQALLEMVGGKPMPKKIVERIKNALGSDCGEFEGRAGFLLDLLEPGMGRAKLAASLTNPAPIARMEAACFLALLGSEPCLEALVQAANGIEAGSHEAACALSLLKNERAQAVAQQWLLRNAGYEEAAGREVELGGRKVRVWDADELMRSNLRGELKLEFERVSEEFAALLKNCGLGWLSTS